MPLLTATARCNRFARKIRAKRNFANIIGSYCSVIEIESSRRESDLCRVMCLFFYGFSAFLDSVNPIKRMTKDSKDDHQEDQSEETNVDIWQSKKERDVLRNLILCCSVKKGDGRGAQLRRLSSRSSILWLGQVRLAFIKFTHVGTFEYPNQEA